MLRGRRAAAGDAEKPWCSSRARELLAPGNDAWIDTCATEGAVPINANQDDEAYGLLTTARANNVRRRGERNAIVANIDSNLRVAWRACSVGVREHPFVLPMRALAPLRAPCILA